MKKEAKTKELFYFHPQNHGYNPDTIDDVHLIGEFNDWGKFLSCEYRLKKDKMGRWVGIFEVEEGKQPYKFVLNKNTYCPRIGNLFYSTVKTPEWAKDRIWYQIFPDRFYKDKEIPLHNPAPWDSKPNFFDNFGGNLSGITKKIDYFKKLYGDLNHFALYLNPLHLSEASNHKYWPEDFEEIDPQFGTEENFKELIEEIHKNDGKIIIDLVYNHTGINHFAFKDILANGPNSKYKNWYRSIPDMVCEKIQIPCLEETVNDWPKNVSIETTEDGIFLDIWGGKYLFPIKDYEEGMSFDEINENQPYYTLIGTNGRANYSCWCGFFEIPELDTYNEDVKKNLFKSTRKWIKLGVDGFRLDVPDTLNNAHGFWKEFRQVIRYEASINNKNPDDIYIVGEVWTNEGISGSFMTTDNTNRPMRFDSIMNYPIREAVLNHFSGQILTSGTDRVERDGKISVCQMDIEIHKNYAHLPLGTNQVQMNCFSTHDTRRLRSILNDDRKFKATLLLQFTMLGLPTIYYGDEIGMLGWTDPNNRATMNWNIADDIENKQEKEIFDYFKSLINLRKEFKCLIESPVQTLYVHNDKHMYSFGRYLNDKDCLISIICSKEQHKDLIIDLEKTPFENLKVMKNYFNEKEYKVENKKINIAKEDLKNFFILLEPIIK